MSKGVSKDLCPKRCSGRTLLGTKTHSHDKQEICGNEIKHQQRMQGDFPEYVLTIALSLIVICMGSGNLYV